MTAEAYRFANHLWVDDVFVGKQLKTTIGKIAIFSVVPWLFGFIIAWLGDLQIKYLSTPAFYVGSIGIFLTTATLVYGSTQQYKMYDRILSCFDLDTEKQLFYIRDDLERHSRFLEHARSALIIVLICEALLVSGLFFWDFIKPAAEAIGTSLPRFLYFQKYGWYIYEYRWFSFIIISTFLIFISVPLGTSASIILRFPIFLWKISGEMPKLPPSLIKVHFSPAASLYTVISVLWLCGASLIFYFFKPNNDWLSFLITFFIFLMGLVSFITPQVAYVRTVGASEDKFLGMLSEQFDKNIIDRLLYPDKYTATEHDNSDNLILLFELTKHDDWVYPLHQTYTVVGFYLISIIGSILGWKKIAEYMNFGN